MGFDEVIQSIKGSWVEPNTRRCLQFYHVSSFY